MGFCKKKHYEQKQGKDKADTCLATTDPQRYCNGFYLYSTKDPGSGKAFVVVKTNNPDFHFKEESGVVLEKKSEVTYEEIEVLRDDVHEFIKDKGYDVLDEFEFLTRLESLLYTNIDKHYD